MILATTSHKPDEPEESSQVRKHRYVSKRDIIIIVCVLFAVIGLCYPIWREWQKRGQQAFCEQNVKAIGMAIQGYCIDNSDRLPPTHYVTDALGTPAFEPETGTIVSWASLVAPYMTARQNFVCPSADTQEALKTYTMRQGDEKTIGLTYGMYRGLSSVSTIMIPDPGSSVLVAETSNHGSNSTFDPLGFPAAQPDGFLIGWNDGNLDFTKRSLWVTRLAFAHTNLGQFSKGGVPRHDGGLNALSADLHLRKLGPADAQVHHDGPRLSGMWWADPNLYH